MKLDYSIENPEERVQYVEKIIAENPKLSQSALEQLANYIIEKVPQEKEIMTNNHLKTVNDRETSYEGLALKFENGEDGLYSLFVKDPNALFIKRIPITEEDREAIPELRELANQIALLEEQRSRATGALSYRLNEQIKAMRYDQYIIRSAHRPTLYSTATPPLLSNISSVDLSENIYMDENLEPHSDCLINLLNQEHVSALLCNYAALKNFVEKRPDTDLYYLIQHFDILLEQTFGAYPLYRALIQYKTEGFQNTQVQELLQQEFGQTHTIEYLSSLWRNKLPKMLVAREKKNLVIWYFKQHPELGWKTCSRCNQTKPAHQYFFSRNDSSKDSYYSICKCCRSKKVKGGAK